jgi:transcriptional repressor NrdR
MKCPFCGHFEDKVIDSRSSKDGDAIRRRRECLKCDRRFTSYERIDHMLPMIIKKDGRREPFDKNKVLGGLVKALEKRPVDMETREEVVASIERKLMSLGTKEVSSKQIGEDIMDRLKELDKVAYVRFASVYMDFKDVAEFMDELRILLKSH